MWVEANMFWGPVIVALTSMVTTVAFIPGTLLALGSGWVFKQAYGSLWIAILLAAGAVWLGAWIGSCIAFLLGRFVLRRLSERLAAKYMVKDAIDEVIKKEGLKLMFLIRLTPFPYNVFNYAIAITEVPFKNYALGGFGMIPTFTMVVFVGTTLASLSEAASGDY